MKRGDLVTVAMTGDYGKPRPALIVQADLFADTESVTVLLVSSHLVEAEFGRITIDPSPVNGLLTSSQIMIDKAMTVPRAKAGRVIGRLDSETMGRIDRAIALFFGIA
ncbi:MAG: type II toxin-antitoxin system PemK/MazF family toxin [Rhizobiaceae bacterium]